MAMAAANPTGGSTPPRARARSRVGPLMTDMAYRPPCDQPNEATRSGMTKGRDWRYRRAPIASSKRAVLGMAARLGVAAVGEQARPGVDLRRDAVRTMKEGERGKGSGPVRRDESALDALRRLRSEERRVGKEWRSRW